MSPQKSIRDLFKTDPRLEVEGVALQFADYGSIVVARSGGANKEARAITERIFRNYRQVMAMNALDRQTELELTAQAAAEGLVKGWTFVDETGEPMPFSVEACKALLVELPDLLEYVIEQSQRIANYALAQRSDEGKS